MAFRSTRQSSPQGLGVQARERGCPQTQENGNTALHTERQGLVSSTAPGEERQDLRAHSSMPEHLPMSPGPTPFMAVTKGKVSIMVAAVPSFLMATS